jgi:hypothetical protein
VHAHIIGYWLAVGTLLPSDMSVLPGRTTVGIIHCLLISNPESHRKFLSFRLWVSQKSSTANFLLQQFNPI